METRKVIDLMCGDHAGGELEPGVDLQKRMMAEMAKVIDRCIARVKLDSGLYYIDWEKLNDDLRRGVMGQYGPHKPHKIVDFTEHWFSSHKKLKAQFTLEVETSRKQRYKFFYQPYVSISNSNPSVPDLIMHNPTVQVL